MNLSKFHISLLRTDPTPEQRRLYEAFPRYRGYSSEDQNPDRFVATFIAALADTWDEEAKACIHKVPLALPRLIEPWCMDQVNLFLDQVKARKLPKPVRRLFLDAMNHVETGTRVFAIVAAPKRWFAYGFDTGSVVPDWIKGGLLE
jgi:hypothetical protein